MTRKFNPPPAGATPGLNFMLQNQAAIMMREQWDDLMVVAKGCLYLRGFSCVSPDEIIIELSEECPWMKFRKRLQREAQHADAI